jgi:hypothetical protein
MTEKEHILRKKVQIWWVKNDTDLLQSLTKNFKVLSVLRLRYYYLQWTFWLAGPETSDSALDHAFRISLTAKLDQIGQTWLYKIQLDLALQYTIN